MRSVCLFCGSKCGDHPAYEDAARRFGAAVARRGLGLVYGGGNVGLMAVAADAALAGGGAVIGVIPGLLAAKEVAHAGLTELHIVASMHARKALMADRSAAFAALPGGFGTADELFEILTWRQLGIHAKPIGVLNTRGFFDPLLAWLDRMVAEGFLKRSNRELLQVSDDVDGLLDLLEAEMVTGE